MSNSTFRHCSRLLLNLLERAPRNVVIPSDFLFDNPSELVLGVYAMKF